MVMVPKFSRRPADWLPAIDNARAVASTFRPSSLALVAAAAGGLHGVRGLVGVVAAASAVGLVLVQALRTIGGVTGDVLGACVEVALTAYLLAEAADPIPG